jgi:hypothetical protein
MKRTTIVADERTLDQLKALARDRGISFAQIIREALEAKATQFRPKPESLGIAASRRGSRTSERAGVGRTPPRSWD